jgi:hypothetical protein
VIMPSLRLASTRLAAFAVGVAVLVRGTDAGADPRGLQVVIEAENPSPVLGVDFETEIRIRAEGPGPTPIAAPRVMASIGHIAEVTRTGDRS